jgi:hypothetical protein
VIALGLFTVLLVRQSRIEDAGRGEAPTRGQIATSTAMSNEQAWNDTTRNELRDSLRKATLGELRLAKRGHKEILDACREVYIQDGCPERERETFVQFATDELNRAASRLASERATWPEETDCDRLDRVEVALRERGILLWQVSPCCDTCTFDELPGRIDVINRRSPGFRNRVRGYSFFIDQNLPEKLGDSNRLSVYLGYGWLSPDGSKVASEVYRKNALGIAREVCECLSNEGFDPDWNGDFDRKIGVSLCWQRRTLLK